MRLSVIVPVLDEERVLRETLRRVRAGLRPGDEVLVVDGGSRDRTASIAGEEGAILVVSGRGRGRQLRAGATRAVGDVLLFLHADTLLPAPYRAELEGLFSSAGVAWGRFDLEFDQGGPLLRLIAWLISRRSRLFRSATGDQAMFVRRDVFDAVGGFLEDHLFEDVDLARRLRRAGRMGIPAAPVVTSSRRWRRRGVWPTTLRMWTLKSLYLAGVPAKRLSRFYSDDR